ncbi:hypothetical protein QUV83_16220 [Cellulomonas cellasea]|uniref:hypothetical protein n=1 Tax=Cellulomonas cellasea TaxID=43670 RepID=UPI0025A3BDE1|nr:hypothetical protein [Cellulomonas cellasea]MDM8086321.1 hypothetical protein [Cellulomonas cellasea]
MSDIDLTAAQIAGYGAVEDTLIDLRDSRISILGYANGVVVNERDGSPSPVVRMRTRWATDQAIVAAAPLIEAAVRAQVSREIEASKRDRHPTPVRSALEMAARIARRGAA